MKKYIFPLLAFALLSTQSWGQTKPTEAQTELNAYMDDGLVTFKSQDGQYSFRVGGQLAVDGVKVSVTPGEMTATTDGRGGFVIENVEPGEYTLQFEAPEFVMMVTVVVSCFVYDVYSF